MWRQEERVSTGGRGCVQLIGCIRLGGATRTQAGGRCKEAARTHRLCKLGVAQELLLHGCKLLRALLSRDPLGQAGVDCRESPQVPKGLLHVRVDHVLQGRGAGKGKGGEGAMASGPIQPRAGECAGE